MTSVQTAGNCGNTRRRRVKVDFLPYIIFSVATSSFELHQSSESSACHSAEREESREEERGGEGRRRKERRKKEGRREPVNLKLKRTFVRFSCSLQKLKNTAEGRERRSRGGMSSNNFPDPNAELRFQVDSLRAAGAFDSPAAGGGQARPASRGG